MHIIKNLITHNIKFDLQKRVHIRKNILLFITTDNILSIKGRFF